MKTVGEIFKETRISRKLTLEEAELSTKIRRKFLEALESDDYSRMPSMAYAKGFVKNYSNYLGLDSEKILAFFRRQNVEVTKSSLLPKKEEKTLNDSIFQLTPSRFIVILIGFLIISFLGYFGLQYQRILTPPSLSVDTPKDNLISVDKRVDVLGTTDTDATVTINGISTLVRSDGKFFDRVTLEKGKNIITITAVSRYGKLKTISRIVMVDG
jgi:cytoskeletal protein RodZ